MASSSLDLSIDSGSAWFRLRACGVILHEGRVLMVGNDRDDYVYSVGGGVHHGETLEEAARREVLEETGVDMEIERLLFIHENFFAESTGVLANKSCHEVAFYFLMKYDPSVQLTSGSLTQDGSATERLRWVALDEFGRHERAFPTFFATELRHLPQEPRHIVTHESI